LRSAAAPSTTGCIVTGEIPARFAALHITLAIRILLHIPGSLGASLRLLVPDLLDTSTTSNPPTKLSWFTPKIRSVVDGFHSFKPRRLLSPILTASLKWLALVVDLLVGVTPNLAKAVKPANVDTFVVMRTSLNAETVRSITAVVLTWTCLFKKKEL